MIIIFYIILLQNGNINQINSIKVVYQKILNITLENKKEPERIEYIIGANDENLRRIRIIKHLFIDSTFHHPNKFK